MSNRYLFFITGMPMGGAERVMSTLANQFVEHGDAVRLVTMKAPECAYSLDPRVELVGAGARLDASSLWQMLCSAVSVLRGIVFYQRQLRSYQPDAVMSFLTYSNMIAVLCGRRSGIPVVISERSDPLQRNKLIVKLVEKIYPKADCIVCQSETIEQYFKNVDVKAHTTVIPNPINLSCINTANVVMRKQTILAVGRLHRQKNYSLMLRAFKQISAEFPDYCLEIYGQGPEEERLRQLIGELGLQERIFLMGTKSNVMKEEANASLYVMSSDFEGFPNALVEAMASGLPVVSTDFPSGVAHELIENGVNGFVVPVGDEDALAGRMREILSSPHLQTVMAERNASIRERFSEASVYQMWNELFATLRKPR